MGDKVEIGRDKHGRRAYTLDDIALMLLRCTRDPEGADVGWQINACHVDIPLTAVPMDSVMSPEITIASGRLGDVGVLDLDGLWVHYKDPTPILDRITHLGEEELTATLQRIYSEPIKPSLVAMRLKQLRETGVIVVGKLSPQRAQKYRYAVVDAGVDLFIIHGPIVSAEYASPRREPLNLKCFIYELDTPVIVGGVCMDAVALHPMRTGAAGVLVGSDGGAAHSTRQSLGVHVPMAIATADVAVARRNYIDESGGRYVRVIADGGIGRSDDLTRVIARGAGAVMFSAVITHAEKVSGWDWHWGSEATHPDMPRGQRVYVGTIGTLEQILYSPSTRVDNSLDFVGTFKRTMTSARYSKVKNLQRTRVVVSPYSVS